MKRCKHIKNNKEQCRANALATDELCFWHSAKSKEEMLNAVQKGGSSPKRSYENEPISLKNTVDVVALIEKTVNELRQNKTSTRLANAIGYLSGIALRAIEQSDLEKRMEVLEYALKIKKHIK